MAKVNGKSRVLAFFKSLFSTFQGFSIFIGFASLLVFFVIFRMRNVELDYNFNELQALQKKSVQINKELKADKADLLSITNLRKIARKYNLKEPNQKRIIVIP